MNRKLFSIASSVVFVGGFLAAQDAGTPATEAVTDGAGPAGEASSPTRLESAGSSIELPTPVQASDTPVDVPPVKKPEKQKPAAGGDSEGVVIEAAAPGLPGAGARRVVVRRPGDSGGGPLVLTAEKIVLDGGGLNLAGAAPARGGTSGEAGIVSATSEDDRDRRIDQLEKTVARLLKEIEAMRSTRQHGGLVEVGGAVESAPAPGGSRDDAPVAGPQPGGSVGEEATPFGSSRFAPAANESRPRGGQGNASSPRTSRGRTSRRTSSSVMRGRPNTALLGLDDYGRAYTPRASTGSSRTYTARTRTERLLPRRTDPTRSGDALEPRADLLSPAGTRPARHPAPVAIRQELRELRDEIRSIRRLLERALARDDVMQGN